MGSTRPYDDYSSGGRAFQSIPDDLRGIHPALPFLCCSSVPGASAATQVYISVPTPHFCGSTTYHCYQAAGKFYELFKSPFCCCQILPSSCQPLLQLDSLCGCVNRPSQDLDITSCPYLTWTSLHPTPHWAYVSLQAPRLINSNLLSVS